MITARVKFKKGDKVKVSARGDFHNVISNRMKNKAKTGVVTGFSWKEDYIVNVRRTGCVQGSGYHMDFWEKV